MGRDKIFVVVPSWNGQEMLYSCLSSLNKQTQKNNIVLIDNGSTDNSIDLVQEKFPNTVIIKNKTNMGFTGGVNPGIEYAMKHNAEYVALFNNDAIADKDWLKKLCEKIKQDSNYGIVGAKILNLNKKLIDTTGEQYSTKGIPFPRGRNQIDKGQYDKEKVIFGASGGASLYSVAMLKEIGLFDEKFFAYYEDVDISFRAQLAGWKVVYEPKAIAYHKIGATSSKMGDFTRYHSIKNFLILYTKDMPAKLYWKYLPKFLYQLIRTTARSIVDLKPHIFLRAVFSFIIYLPAVLKERRKIQNNRKVPVEYIDEILYKQKPPKIPII